MGWGSVLVGHARPEVVGAVIAQAAQGSNYAYVTEPSLALAEEILRVSPASERSLRFCASGTEATMYCQRLARAVTGRPKILKFEGAYHGANEVGVTSLFPADPPDFPEPDPTSGGIAHMVARDVLVAPYNDLETTARDHRGAPSRDRRGHRRAAAALHPARARLSRRPARGDRGPTACCCCSTKW